MTALLAYDLDTQPGEWVTEQACGRERVVWLALGTLVLLMLSAIGVYVGFGLVGTPLSIVVLALMIIVKRFVEPRVTLAVRWTRGARTERTVGANLDELRREGYVVMHDLEQNGEGNIDHLVSGRSGVYLVETKYRSYREDQLRKAKRQAAKVASSLGVWVTPLICIGEREARAPYRHDGVWILSLPQLTEWIKSQRNRTVEFERLARFADQL